MFLAERTAVQSLYAGTIFMCLRLDEENYEG